VPGARCSGEKTQHAPSTGTEHRCPSSVFAPPGALAFLFSGGVRALCAFQSARGDALRARHQPAMFSACRAARGTLPCCGGELEKAPHVLELLNRMPYVDFPQSRARHSPFIWSRLHARASSATYAKSGSASGSPIHRADAPPRYRLGDRRRSRGERSVPAAPPSNYLPPFYTHTRRSTASVTATAGGRQHAVRAPARPRMRRGRPETMKGESEGGCTATATTGSMSSKTSA